MWCPAAAATAPPTCAATSGTICPIRASPTTSTMPGTSGWAWPCTRRRAKSEAGGEASGQLEAAVLDARAVEHAQAQCLGEGDVLRLADVQLLGVGLAVDLHHAAASVQPHLGHH